jgi:hypothetical protein
MNRSNRPKASNQSDKETDMLRKTILASAASLLLAAGMAYAANESCFPSGANECGPAAGEAPTTSVERAAPAGKLYGESCFPSGSSECGPAAGQAPTTAYQRPVGATGSAAGGEVPMRVLVPGWNQRGSGIDD